MISDAQFRALLVRVLILERKLGSFTGGVGVPSTRELFAGSGLTGGGTLESDRTFNVGAGVGITVGANDVNVNIAAATIATDEATNSTSYTDLTTTGPAVTLTTGTSVFIWMSAIAYKTTVSNSCWISPAVSGASSIAASDANAVQTSSYNGLTPALPMARILLLSGLTAGSNTFTLRYRVDGGTFNFFNRSIAVLAL